jgi:hypothetical protein
VRPAARPWWLPSLGEVVFASVLGWLLLAGSGSQALLADADTGWHLRTGDYILDQRRFPATDRFSYSKPGAEWFAWEWGSDVLLALAHRAGGLAGVVLFGAVLIAAAAAALFQFLLWRGANVIVALVVLWGAASASTVHWLARPHLFTCLFFILSLWLLEADRARPACRLWLAVPLGALWVNLHAGFVILPLLLACYSAGALLERDRRAGARYGAAALAALAATLANPYGWRLHAHIAQYLQSDFIRRHVEEFQSPRFRGESMLVFEAFLLGGLLVLPRLWRQRHFGLALAVLGLAHAALGSVRHVLLYVSAAAPALAEELTRQLERRRSGWWPDLAALGRDFTAPRGQRWRTPMWALAAIVGTGVLLGSGVPRWQAGFPEVKFPLEALAAAEEKVWRGRLFTSDQWANYLIYRYAGRLRVFIDGRSDFYGPRIGQDYLDAMGATSRWRDVFDRYGFEVALVPPDWPLATVLKAAPDWNLDYDDGRALVLSRVRSQNTISAHY